MSNATSNQTLIDGMRLGKLQAIHTELMKYRDYAPVGPEDKRGSGEILPFVRGLYFSARLIYFLREMIKGLDIHWGHVIHESRPYFSPECDIIIHKNGSLIQWNGNVLDFHFIDFKQVVAVISCKSIVASVDEDYCKKLLSFGIPRVALFGESCSASNYENLRNKATDAGYSGFWCLALDEKEGPKLDGNMHIQFFRFLETLKAA